MISLPCLDMLSGAPAWLEQNTGLWFCCGCVCVCVCVCIFISVMPSSLTHPSSPLIGRIPQVAAEPRRAPQKRRLMGSAVPSVHFLSKKQKKNTIKPCRFFVCLFLLINLWLERSYWIRLE